ncbi:50S ribosomal protein L1 [Candidatus Woesearchaeota archaeon]|nr:50S ribosomal protein L1 [Candidatus Woesearchaeota archaeon]
MDKAKVQEALAKLRKDSPKRNFQQSIDLIVNLRGLDLKKTEQQFEIFFPLPHGKGKPVRVCALVGPELHQHAKEVCNTAIVEQEFEKYGKEKKILRKLAEGHDFFIAQANIMPRIATVFGKVLGPKKKMPNPKAGCIVPPKTNLKPLVEKLQNTARISVKEKLFVQLMVGIEAMKDEQIVENVMTAYEQLLPNLPNEKNNIKNMFLKFTMSKPVRLM